MPPRRSYCGAAIDRQGALNWLARSAVVGRLRYTGRIPRRQGAGGTEIPVVGKGQYLIGAVRMRQPERMH